MRQYILRIAILIAITFLPNNTWGQNKLSTATKSNLEGDYYLDKDLNPTGSSRFNVETGKTATIDLNGKTIDASELDYALFRVKDGGKLIIKGAGTLKNSKVSCFYVLGTLEFNDATIKNCKPSDGNGGAMDIQATGKVTMKSGKIENCRGVQGGGVYVLGEFTLEGGEIVNNMVNSVYDSNN